MTDSGDEDQRLRVTILIGQTGLGGAERQLVHLLQHRDTTRFSYQVVVLNSRAPYTVDQEIERLGVPLLQVPEDYRGVLSRVRWLTRMLRRQRPHLLHSWSFYANSYAGLVGRLAGVPVRLGSMRNQPDSATIQAMNRWLRRLATRSVDAVVVNSRRALAQMRAGWLPESRLHLVENAVSVPPEAAARDLLAEHGIDADCPLVGSVGNLQSGKNHAMFVRVMARVVERIAPAHGVIVGRERALEPGAAARLEQLIADTGLTGRVVLTGPRRDVPELLQRFSVLCLTSLAEGMPNVVLEAMAAACPVVSTRAGDVPSLITDGDDGFLVEADDDAAMAAQVCRLLADRELARSVGERGRTTVLGRYDCRRMAQQMEAVYQDQLHRISINSTVGEP